MNHYTQLTEPQRYQIYALQKALKTQKTIAEIVGVHPSTISRELRRNKGLRAVSASTSESIRFTS